MKDFVKLLRQAAAILSEFSETSTANSLRWDGSSYAQGRGSAFDPHAAKWWATLSATAELLDRQEGTLSAAQKSYLDRLLFGGMGSLIDCAVDEGRLGTAATVANRALDDVRKSLFEEFSKLP